jgi:hypothetical protein
VNFVIGENVFIGPALLMLAAKIVTIGMGWLLAMLIAFPLPKSKSKKPTTVVVGFLFETW